MRIACRGRFWPGPGGLIDAVLTRIRAAHLPGVRFRGVTFTPKAPGDGKYADTALAGIRLELTDRDRYDPTATAVHLLAAVRAASGDRFSWIPKHFDRLAGGPTLREALDAGTDASTIVASWAADTRRFLDRRRPFLLYQE